MHGNTPTTSHLLIDDRLIDETRHVEPVLGIPQKHASNPLITETAATLGRFDNLYANVVYDGGPQQYRCWFSPFVLWNNGGPRQMRIFHIASTNGLNWQVNTATPVAFDGSGEAVFGDDGPHGAGIIHDADESDPQRRYKMFAKRDAEPPKKKRMHVAFSADGLQWTRPRACPSIQPIGNTHHNALWDPGGNCYAGFVRQYQPAHQAKKGEVRTIARTESLDFVKWSTSVMVLRALACEEPQRQVYALQVFRYSNIFLGLVMMHTDKDADSLDCELAWSPDTKCWSRVCPGHPLIPRGESYDSDCIFTAAYPIVLEDQIRIYYCGSTGGHRSPERMGHFCLATLPRDRFAGLKTIRRQDAGVITTKAVQCEGNHLHVNAEAANGSLKIQILDSENNLLHRCNVAGGDVMDERVGCPEKAADLRKLRGKKVRLAFELHNAVLYSFSFRQ